MAKKRSGRGVQAPGKAPAPGRSRRATIAAALTAAVAVLGAWWLTKPSNPVPTAAPAERVAPARSASPSSTSSPEALRGRWQRADGGYVLEIRSVGPDGALDARYFNPAPIHVSQARVTSVEGASRVFVELRDVNYPGSTYTLTYDPANDMLAGVYFQAVQRQQFDVTFVRQR
jgi:hypothetical protein